MKKTIAGLAISTAIVTLCSSAAFATKVYINDLQKVCAWQYPGTTAILSGTSVYNWKCKTSSNQCLDLNIYGYCQYKYGSTANTSFDDYALPYSWYCYY